MNTSAQYVPGTRIQELYDVSSATLRRWANQERIAVRRGPGGRRLYSVSDIRATFGQDDITQAAAEDAATRKKKSKVGYARVSSEHQRGDLERQLTDLREQCPGYDEFVSDVGSGLNWKRPRFQALLGRVLDGDIEEVTITHRDRLCRFGFDLMEFLFRKAGTGLVVLGDRAHNSHEGSTDCRSSSSNELAEDLLSVVTVFVARHNGQRSAQNRRDQKKRQRLSTSSSEQEAEEEEE